MATSVRMGKEDEYFEVFENGDLGVQIEGRYVKIEVEEGGVSFLVDGEPVASTTAFHPTDEVEQLTDEQQERLEKLREFGDEWGWTVGLMLEAIRIIQGF